MPAVTSIIYQLEPGLAVEAFTDVLRRSTLAERRPVDDQARMAAMLQHADIIVTARSGELLVGVARAITDFSFCCYVSDLAVDREFQKQGIGRKLLAQVKLTAGADAKIILLAAPKAASYYPHIGMTQHHSCWVE
jgi:GNAT superfamily N-acetyltransferase